MSTGSGSTSPRFWPATKRGPLKILRFFGTLSQIPFSPAPNLSQGLGCRRSLSGRKLYRRQLEGVERPVPRRHPWLCQGDTGTVRALAQRVLGSPDIYGHQEREPEQSVNFVTCHDGFTLNDLVSYNEKHNEANGEGNRDGSDHNLSGTAASKARATMPRRERAGARSRISCHSADSVGTHDQMGDEMRRTQRGNNNAYCHDDEVTGSTGFARPTSGSLPIRADADLPSSAVDEAATYASFELSLNELLRSAEIEWHGVRLGSADWADISHSIAFTLRPGRGRLISGCT